MLGVDKPTFFVYDGWVMEEILYKIKGYVPLNIELKDAISLRCLLTLGYSNYIPFYFKYEGNLVGFSGETLECYMIRDIDMVSHMNENYRLDDMDYP